MTDPVPPPRPEPGRGYRWLVLLSVSLTLLANYYVFDAMNPVGPLLEAGLGFSQAQIGALDSAYNLAALLVLLAGGVLVDRVGTKRAMVIFAAVASLGGLLIALSPGGYAGMAAGRFVFGLGSEPLVVAATTALGRWFKGKELSLAMALNLSLARLGSVAADRSSSWASGLFTSWQPPLLLAAAVGGGSLVLAAAYAFLEGGAERRYRLGRAGPSDKLVLADLWRFGRAYWWVVGLCVAFYSVVFPFRRFANLFFIDAHGASPAQAGDLNSLLPTAAMFATPLFGFLADRVGKRALLLVVGSFLLVPPFLLMAYTGLPLALPVALLGISFSLVPAVLWPSVTYLVDERRLGTAYALMTFLQQVGWAAVALAVGAANDHFGAGRARPAGYTPGMWLFAAVALVGFLCALRLWRAERGAGSHGIEAVRPS